ncbi:PerC family transcriptional regulator [Serratia nevei]|nr:PerC family transcriptional regulator [Serratia nevei]
MSSGHYRGYRSQDDALPADAQALHLETLGLWRRAAARWQQVLLREADDHEAEAVLQRLRYCLAQVATRAPRVSDGTALAGATLVEKTGVPNGPDLWRME